MALGNPVSVQIENRRASIRTALQELTRSRSPVRAEHIRQLDQELGVIKGKGLSDFFLLVGEVVEFAKSRGIRHSIRGFCSRLLVSTSSL
jgi:DNA polymerase III alpha subunit